MKELDNDHQITIAPQTILLTIAVLIGLYLLYQVNQIVITLFLAVIMMSALAPAVRALKKWLHFPTFLAIMSVYISLIASIVLMFALIIPPLVHELPNFIGSLNLPPLPDDIRQFKFTLSELNSFVEQIRGSFGAVFSIITSTFSGIFTFFTVLVMTAYLLLDRNDLHKKVSWFTKEPKHLAMAKEFVDSAEHQLGGWVRGELFLMLIIGITSYVGLVLLGMPYAVPLAILAGFLEILPNLGPTLSAVPAILIAYTVGGFPMAGIVTALYIVIQQCENHFIVPKVMKDSVDVNPLTTIVVILIGLKLGNVVGALLAVPIYIVMRSAYSIWRRSKNES